MTILDKIMAERREAVTEARRRVPLQQLQDEAARRTPLSLSRRLASSPGPQIIAETKKASPSAGLLRPDYAPGHVAAGYEAAGACAVSVLTEPLHFLGSAQDLREVRARVSIPVLRKDFMCDPYQMAEAAAWGADVILLIVAALDPGLMQDLHGVARSYGLDVLVESHTADELALALELPDALIGVNSRNLKTLTTDLAVAYELAPMIPAERIAIAESGISQHQQIENLAADGYQAFLVGEALVREGDPAGRLRELLGRDG